MIMTFEAPLRVTKTKKKDFILNLNNYRNAHYMVLNNSKRAFCKEMDQRYPMAIKPFKKQIFIRYELFPKTRRLTDVSNPCCIIGKYFEDWLVDRGIIVDDNSKYVWGVSYFFGKVDKANPRCEIVVNDIE